MKKFIILARERTGSTIIQSALNKHSDIRCYNETFDHKKLKRRNRTIASEKKRIWGNLRYKVTGVKIFYNHANADFWKWCKSKNISVIHLKRQNKLRTVVSHLIACKTGWWRLIRGRKRTSLNKKMIKVDYIDLAQRINGIKNNEEWGDNYFKDNPIITVYYEDLCKDLSKELKKIQKFLGVKVRNLKPVTKKQNKESLEKLIINYNYIKKKLIGTKWEAYLEE